MYYKRPPFQDVNKGITIENDGRHLVPGHKRDGNWNFVSIALAAGLLVE